MSSLQSSSLQSSSSSLSSCSRTTQESSTSSTSQRVHRQVSEMTTMSSSELQNLQQQQQQLHHRLTGCGDNVESVEPEVTAYHCSGHVAPVDGADPLVTFPESPPVLVSNLSPLLHHATAARPKPVRIAAASTASAMDGQQKFASAAERRVSTSKLVKEAYESCSSSSSSSSSTVSDSQDVLQSLHHGDVLKHHAANTIRARLTGTIADHEKTEKTLNKVQVWCKRINYFSNPRNVFPHLKTNIGTREIITRSVLFIYSRGKKNTSV